MQTAKKLIANELMPVYQTTDTGEKIVDGRELHEFLKVGKDFSTWMRDRVEKYGFIEKEDFDLTLTRIGERQNVTRHDYILKLDMAKELSMVENNEQGRKARKYFIEIEKRFKASGGFKVIEGAFTQNEAKPNLEFDQVAKLLQILRVGNRDGVFNETTENAIRLQIAELVTGKPVYVLKNDLSANKHKERPEGCGIKEIANSLGVTYQKAVWVAKKNNLKQPEYGSLYTYDYKGQQKEIFIYNQAGKEKIAELLCRKKGHRR